MHITQGQFSFLPPLTDTEIRAQVPAMAAGTYLVYVVAADGYTTLRVNGVTYV